MRKMCIRDRYGPIIHNEEVVRDLEEKGIRVIRSLDELEHLSHGKIIVDVYKRQIPE